VKYENTALMHEKLAYAMVRAPRFNPEDGRTQDYVFNELRTRLTNMQKEWWGGDAVYQRMVELIDRAEAHLKSGDSNEAIREFGEIYAIIDQTPRPKKANTA
jgi:hypothetical protein